MRAMTAVLACLSLWLRIPTMPPTHSDMIAPTIPA
jgi:hypothetical protein